MQMIIYVQQRNEKIQAQHAKKVLVCEGASVVVAVVGRWRKHKKYPNDAPRRVVHVLCGPVHFLDIMEPLAQSTMPLLDLLRQKILARGFTTVPFVRHPILTPK